MPATYEEAIERARALKPVLRERVAETERLRRLPAENVADLLENGLYGLMTPKRFGGSELGSETMIDVTIELASACPSTGWVHMLWTAHMWLLALFPPESAGGAVEQPEHARLVGGQHRRRGGARGRRLPLDGSRLLLERRRPLQLADRGGADQARRRGGASPSAAGC